MAETGLLTYSLDLPGQPVLSAQFSGSVVGGDFLISGIQALTFDGVSLNPSGFPIFDSADELIATALGAVGVPDLPATIALDGSFLDLLIADAVPVFGGPSGDGFTFGVDTLSESLVGYPFFNGGPSFGGGHQEEFALSRFSFELVQDVPESSTVIAAGFVGVVSAYAMMRARFRS